MQLVRTGVYNHLNGHFRCANAPRRLRPRLPGASTPRPRIDAAGKNRSLPLLALSPAPLFDPARSSCKWDCRLRFASLIRLNLQVNSGTRLPTGRESVFSVLLVLQPREETSCAQSVDLSEFKIRQKLSRPANEFRSHGRSAMVLQLLASLPLPAIPSEPENFDRSRASALFRLTTFHFFLHRLGVVSPKQISGRCKRVSATP